jgi:hypothetical protein
MAERERKGSRTPRAKPLRSRPKKIDSGSYRNFVDVVDLSFADNIPELGVSQTQSFQGVSAGTISRDEIYHRVEWYFDRNHSPQGPHQIPPNVAMSLLLRNVTMQTFYVNLCRAGQTFFPAWGSMLLHGVAIPWVASAPGIPGISNCTVFGDVVVCICASYGHAGWRVT